MSQTSDMVRKEFRKNVDIRNAGLETPDNIQRYDDIIYGEDPKWQALDVYRLKEAAGQKLPVIINVHGGGWVFGAKEFNQYYCMSLAQHGFAVVNFSYRLAPENKHPSSLEDTNSVVTWVMDHGDEYGFDLNHVFLMGDSAGAHILGLYACMCTNPEYAAEYDFKVPDGFVPTALALNCGAYRIEVGKGDAEKLTEALMEDFLPEKGSEKEVALVGVTNHITEDFPPAFVMTCQGDFLKGQALVLIEKMEEKNIPFIYRMYGNKKDPLTHVFNINIRLAAGKLCNDEECRFFKSFLNTDIL